MGLFDKLDKHTDLMTGMAERLGVDFAEKLAANPDLASQYRNAVFTCTSCRDVGECKGWLAEHDKAEHTPDYCLNKDLLEGLAKG